MVDLWTGATTRIDLCLEGTVFVLGRRRVTRRPLGRVQHESPAGRGAPSRVRTSSSSRMCATGTARRIEDNDDMWGLRWSPDGRRLAFFSVPHCGDCDTPQKVEVVDADGSDRHIVTDGPGAGMVAWRADSQSLLVGSDGAPDSGTSLHPGRAGRGRFEPHAPRDGRASEYPAVPRRSSHRPDGLRRLGLADRRRRNPTAPGRRARQRPLPDGVVARRPPAPALVVAGVARRHPGGAGPGRRRRLVAATAPDQRATAGLAPVQTLIRRGTDQPPPPRRFGSSLKYSTNSVQRPSPSKRSVQRL